MFDPSGAFSGFAVDDLDAADTLGLTVEVLAGTGCLSLQLGVLAVPEE